MYQTRAQNLTLDKVLGKSKANKQAAKVTYATADKQRASAVLARLVAITPVRVSYDR